MEFPCIFFLCIKGDCIKICFEGYLVNEESARLQWSVLPNRHQFLPEVRNCPPKLILTVLHIDLEAPYCNQFFQNKDQIVLKINPKEHKQKAG